MPLALAEPPVLRGDEDNHTGEDRESGAKDHKKTESKPVKINLGRLCKSLDVNYASVFLYQGSDLGSDLGSDRISDGENSEKKQTFEIH